MLQEKFVPVKDTIKQVPVVIQPLKKIMKVEVPIKDTVDVKDTVK